MSGLTGKRVMITRSPEQADEFSKQLEKQGAIPLRVPLIQTVPPEDWDQVDEAIDHLAKFDLVVFSSRNGVKSFCERVRERGREDSLNQRTLAAIGPRTATHLQAYGFSVQILPPKAHAAEELRDAIVAAMPLKGKKVLFPRALEGRAILVDALKGEGAEVRLLPVYRTMPSPEGAKLLSALMRGSKTVDWLTFASSSAVRFLGQLAGKQKLKTWVEQEAIDLAVIGRVTAKTLQEWGLEATVVAAEPSGEGMIEAMLAYERKRQDG